MEGSIDSARSRSEQWTNGAPCHVPDKEAVLDMARREGVSGILGIGCKEAVAAAYATRRLELPGQSYAAAQLFHDRLALWQFADRHGFRVPNYRDITERMDLDGMSWPVYVSPAETAGALDPEPAYDVRQLLDARMRARRRSTLGMVIAQESPSQETGENGDAGIYIVSSLIVRSGSLQPMILNECMMRQEHQGPTMVGCRYPARLDARSRALLAHECTRLIALLQLQNAQIDMLAYAAPGRTPYILAIGPGLSALRMPLFLSHLYGRDLYRDAVRVAAGDLTECGSYELPQEGMCLTYYTVRAPRSGILRWIRLRPELEPYIAQWDCQVSQSAQLYIDAVQGQNLGRLVLRFENEERMNDVLARIPGWIDIEMDAW